MKKIFILIGGLGLGGTEKQLLLKVSSLKKKYDFTIIIFYRKGELFKEFRKLGLKIIDLTNNIKFTPLKYLFIYFKIFKILRKKKPDILNLYLPHSYLIAGSLSFFFKNIIFLMSRRSLNNYQKSIPFVNFIEKKILHKKMNFILVNSKAIQNQLIKEEGVDESKIKIIYNSIKVKRQKKKYDKDKIRILCVANLIKYKNHTLILKACNEIKNIGNFQIDFIGDGDVKYKNKLIQIAKSFNISNKIIFWGQMKDYINISSYADIGVLSSDEEGFSNSVLEYMSIKLPVIVTNVGGNSEIVDHGVNGYLVEKDDYQKFAYYLKKLILDKSLRLKLGSNGYNLINRKFEITKNLKNYDKFYENLIK